MELRRLCFLAFTVVFFIGCTTTSIPIQNYASVKDLKKTLEEDIEITKSRDVDVRRALGDPQIVSYYEASSVENQLLKFSLLDQVTNLMRTDVVPDTAWTYIQPIDEKSTKVKRTIQVLGFDVYYKDFRIANVFFNKKGEVVGYNITSHSIQ